MKIKELMPHCCIGADVIVGFPGESEACFLETFNFLKDLPLSYLHVFTYSERNKTLANEMQDVIPLQIRKERSRQLRSLSLKKRRHFYEECLQSERPVLFESKVKGSMLEGWTDNYVKVVAPFDESLINQIVNARLVDIDEDGRVLTEIF